MLLVHLGDLKLHVEGSFGLYINLKINSIVEWIDECLVVGLERKAEPSCFINSKIVFLLLFQCYML